MTTTAQSSRLSQLREFAQFIAAGGAAAIANLSSRYLLNFFVPFEVAVLLAYLVGMVIAFILFQRAIFGDPGTGLRRQILRFIQVNLLGGVLTVVLSSLLARYLLPEIGWKFRPYDLAHFIGVCAPAISSYYLHKYYTYR